MICEDGIIDLWVIDLKKNSLPEHFKNKLNAHEKRKYENIKDHLLKSTYLNAHFATRSILGSYLNRLPEEVNYTYSKFGKPYLTPAFNEIKNIYLII